MSGSIRIAKVEASDCDPCFQVCSLQTSEFGVHGDIGLVGGNDGKGMRVDACKGEVKMRQAGCVDLSRLDSVAQPLSDVPRLIVSNGAAACRTTGTAAWCWEGLTRAVTTLTCSTFQRIAAVKLGGLVVWSASTDTYSDKNVLLTPHHPWLGFTLLALWT